MITTVRNQMTAIIMKKRYSKPHTQVIKIELTSILCGSGDRTIPGWGSGFGQIPGQMPDRGDSLA